MKKADRKARLIAFYLPQYHPIPENDKWWGKGFTEWTNVTKAKPLFPGHYQPNLPGDLGFYDLRVPETRIAQAELASQYGIEGFCYWHYWFGNGRRILERPFREVLETGEPDFPFCLAWANQTWTGIWHGSPDKVLMKQEYPGIQDYTEHFYAIIDAFRDHRYLTVDGKKLFLIYNPPELPDASVLIQHWRDLAAQEGVGELFFVATGKKPSKDSGFDGFVSNAPVPQLVNLTKKTSYYSSGLVERLFNKINSTIKQLPRIYDYEDLARTHLNSPIDDIEFPIVIPNWDNTPRSSVNGVVLENSTPELFGKILRKAVDQVKHRPYDRRIIFVKSWNEWAEGNYLEPDQRFGRGFLEVTKKEVMS